jgi:hypothetical protein
VPDTKIRHYELSCGTEYRNTEIWPVGTLVHCPAHKGSRHRIVKKLRKMTTRREQVLASA